MAAFRVGIGGDGDHAPRALDEQRMRTRGWEGQRERPRAGAAERCRVERDPVERRNGGIGRQAVEREAADRHWIVVLRHVVAADDPERDRQRPAGCREVAVVGEDRAAAHRPDQPGVDRTRGPVRRVDHLRRQHMRPPEQWRGEPEYGRAAGRQRDDRAVLAVDRERDARPGSEAGGVEGDRGTVRRCDRDPSATACKVRGPGHGVAESVPTRRQHLEPERAIEGAVERVGIRIDDERDRDGVPAVRHAGQLKIRPRQQLRRSSVEAVGQGVTRMVADEQREVDVGTEGERDVAARPDDRDVGGLDPLQRTVEPPEGAVRVRHEHVVPAGRRPVRDRDCDLGCARAHDRERERSVELDGRPSGEAGAVERQCRRRIAVERRTVDHVRLRRVE